MNDSIYKDNKSQQAIKQKFITVKETAERYRTSEAMIYRWISQKRFPDSVVFRIGNKILVNRENLEIFESAGGNILEN